MSVLEIDAYTGEAPNAASPVGTFTDDDLVEFSYDIEHRGLNRGSAAIRRDNPKASLVNEGWYYKVRIPVIQSAPLVAFWHDDGLYHLGSRREKAGELVKWGGPGPLWILRLARLLHSVWAPGQPYRGDQHDTPDEWWWANEAAIAILTRGIEEGQNQLAGSGWLAPLDGVTIDFNRVTDSAGVPHANTIDEFRIQVGAHLLALSQQLQDAGNFTLEGEPNLLFHAWQTYPGRNLTASVHLQKAVNIASELGREVKAKDAWTHMIQRDGAGAYSTEVLVGLSARRVRVGYGEVDQTTDDGELNRIAQETLRASRSSLQSLAVDVAPGAFLVGKGSGQVWTGDTVSLSSIPPGGTPGPMDYDAEPQLVTGINLSLAKAADDTNATTRGRSLRAILRFNQEQRLTYDAPAQRASGGPAAVRPVRLCDPAIACENLGPDQLTAGTAANGGVESGASTQWTGGSVDTTRAHGGLQSYGVANSAAVDLAYAWDTGQVFEAGVRYVMHVWASQGGVSPTQALLFGVAGVDEVSVTDPIMLQENQPGSVGAALWNQYRLCWVPSADRTGVRFRWQETQSPSGHFVLDDLVLFTAPDDTAGTSPQAVHCDHEHRALHIRFSGMASGLAADNVQGAFEEHIADADAHHLENHAARHASGGADAVKLDDLAAPDDNTDLNASTTNHGLLPKLSGNSATYLDGSGAFSTPGGGGGGALVQAYVGKNAIGASIENVTGRRVYMKKITLADACLLTDIEAYIDGAKTSAGAQVDSWGAALLADNAGSPREVIQLGGVPFDTSFLPDHTNNSTNDNIARWLGIPIGRWLAAGDYWLAVYTLESAPSGLRIYYDASVGGDRYYGSGGQFVADSGFYTVTTTTNDYSIRANTIR